jgi:hypothetical protein
MCSLTMKPWIFSLRDQDQLRVGHRDRLAVVAGDHAAHRDAAEGVHAPHHRVEDPAADILEVPIDTVGAGFLQRPRQALGVQVGLVVDAGIKTEFAHRIGTFFRPTGDAHCAAATRLGQRTKSRTDGAGGGADHHRLPGYGHDDVIQADPGGDAGHADRAEILGQGHL